MLQILGLQYHLPPDKSKILLDGAAEAAIAQLKPFLKQLSLLTHRHGLLYRVPWNQQVTWV